MQFFTALLTKRSCDLQIEVHGNKDRNVIAINKEQAQLLLLGRRSFTTVVASSAIRLSKISAPFEPITFEHLIARVTVSSSSHIFVVVYRHGSAKVTAAFFDELRLLLEFLSSFAMPYVITGDLNIRFDCPEDQVMLRAT